MKNRNSQLNIIKNLIKEEIKLLKKNNQFFLNEDVAATLDATAVIKLGTPVLKVDKSTNGATIYITNVKGYKSFSLKGFDDLYKISVFENPKNTDIERDVIKLNYVVSKEIIGLPRLINAMEFKVTNDVGNKSITLELSYVDKAPKPFSSVQHNININTPDPNAAFNKAYRIGVLHNKYKVSEDIELILPKGMAYNGVIGQPTND